MPSPLNLVDPAAERKAKREAHNHEIKKMPVRQREFPQVTSEQNDGEQPALLDNNQCCVSCGAERYIIDRDETPGFRETTYSDHCGLCPDCWSKLTPAQQSDRSEAWSAGYRGPGAGIREAALKFRERSAALMAERQQRDRIANLCASAALAARAGKPRTEFERYREPDRTLTLAAYDKAIAKMPAEIEAARREGALAAKQGLSDRFCRYGDSPNAWLFTRQRRKAWLAGYRSIKGA